MLFHAIGLHISSHTPLPRGARADRFDSWKPTVPWNAFGCAPSHETPPPLDQFWRICVKRLKYFTRRTDHDLDSLDPNLPL